MFGFTFLSDPTLRFACMGLIALRAFCLTTPPFGHPSKGGEWTAQGIIHHSTFFIIIFRAKNINHWFSIF
jgi:hypothetical protein